MQNKDGLSTDQGSAWESANVYQRFSFSLQSVITTPITLTTRVSVAVCLSMSCCCRVKDAVRVTLWIMVMDLTLYKAQMPHWLPRLKLQLDYTEVTSWQGCPILAGGCRKSTFVRWFSCLSVCLTRMVIWKLSNQFAWGSYSYQAEI